MTFSRETKFLFWSALSVVNLASLTVALRYGVVNWVAIAFFLISVAYANHYA